MAISVDNYYLSVMGVDRWHPRISSKIEQYIYSLKREGRLIAYLIFDCEGNVQEDCKILQLLSAFLKTLNFEVAEALRIFEDKDLLEVQNSNFLTILMGAKIRQRCNSLGDSRCIFLPSLTQGLTNPLSKKEMWSKMAAFCHKFGSEGDFTSLHR